MAKNDKGNAVIKSQSIDGRVLQSRTTQNAIAFNNSDISIGVNINSNDRANVGDLTLTFNKSANTKANWGVGSNSTIFKSYSSNSIVKSFATNIDNNGAGNGTTLQSYNNYFYLEDFSGITSLTISSGLGIQSIGFQVSTSMPEVTTFTSNSSIVPNFAFLDKLTGLRNLSFTASISTFTNLTSLKNSNLKSLILKGYNTTQPDLLLNLPASLYYLEITQMTSFVVNLPDYFTGNRIAINFSQDQSIHKIEYTGVCIFPAVIADTAQYRIPSTSYLYNQIKVLLNGTNLAKFLIDFANQVTTVTLGNSAVRRMKFTGSTVDSSYIDPDTTRSIRTATEAISKIGSLGVTISFN